MYFQCTNVFLSAQMYFSVHNYISQCLVTWFPVHFCCSVGTFSSCYLPCKSIGLREYFNSTLESMFCFCCGAQVQISFSFCPSCGGSLKSNNDPDCISRVENVGRETAAINSRKRASSSILTRPDLLRAKLPTYEQFASKKSDERRGHFKVFLEAKVTLSDCRNFFQLIDNDNKNSHAKFQVDTTKLFRDIGERIFVSRADLAGKVRHHTVPKTLSSCFGIPQGWSRWQIADIKPCHPIQMTLFDHGGGSSNTRVGDSFQRERVNKFPWYSEYYLKFVILVWLTKFVSQLVFKEVLWALRGWSVVSPQRPKKETSLPGSGSFAAFLVFYG